MKNPIDIEDANVYEIVVVLKKVIIATDVVDVLHEIGEALKDIPFDVVDIKIGR